MVCDSFMLHLRKSTFFTFLKISIFWSWRRKRFGQLALWNNTIVLPSGAIFSVMVWWARTAVCARARLPQARPWRSGSWTVPAPWQRTASRKRSKTCLRPEFIQWLVTHCPPSCTRTHSRADTSTSTEMESGVGGESRMRLKLTFRLANS